MSCLVDIVRVGGSRNRANCTIVAYFFLQTRRTREGKRRGRKGGMVERENPSLCECVTYKAYVCFA